MLPEQHLKNQTNSNGASALDASQLAQLQQATANLSSLQLSLG